MNTLDIIMLIPLAYFAYRGFSKGFIITLAMLAGLLLGLYAAIHLSEYTSNLLQNDLHFHSTNIRWIAYLLTFITVIVLVYLLGQFLTGIVKTTGLGLLNRIAGLLLGIAKGVLIVSAFLVLFGKIDPKSYLISSELKKGSVLYKPLSSIAMEIYPVMEKYSEKAKEMILGNEQTK
ncbi:MAG: CvpA family protein [Bacteroidetes bacterium]|nr:CvpA family protein [Bacteroidota bacterium]